MQFIILIETSRENDSDKMYIDELLKHVYDIKGHKLSYIYMNGKGNYDKKSSQVEQKTRSYQDESKVVICIDLDNQNTTYDQKKKNEEIEKYCKDNNYDLVVFNRDIEEVFIGKKIGKKLKKQTAERFVRQDQVKKVDLVYLDKKDYSSIKTSNICSVFDKFLSRK